MDVLIRDVKLEDVEILVEIYKPYVLETAVSFEYEVPSVQEFTNRVKNTIATYPYLVAEIDNEVVGYAYASSFHQRAAYQWCAEVSIYLKAEMKKNGIGRKLYEELEARLKLQNIKNINACIANPNEASIKFHEKMGFKEIGHFHNCGYKLNKWWDMIWMEKFIGKHEIEPVAFLKVKDINDKVM